MRLWVEGAFDLVCSPLVLGELERALAYPKLAKHIAPDEARAVLDVLTESAVMVEDPDRPPGTSSPDPGDDYLIALAESARALLVSGDKDVLSLAGEIPVCSPKEFLTQL